MPGPLTESHAEIEAECASCHTRFARQSQNQLCLVCHEDVAEDLAVGSGFHGLSTDIEGAQCATCHTDHEGRDHDIMGLDADTFDHALTDFILLGAHVDAKCESCHLPATPFHMAETECVSCHIGDDQHLGNLGAACADCHSEVAWSDATFDHEAVTAYPLTGGHVGLACVGCHIDELYENTSDQCVACHRDDDTHEGDNGGECQSCHTTEDWADLQFNHFADTGFDLSGSHATLTCESCHRGNKFEQVMQTECVGCHRDDDAHDGINGEVCQDCHSSSDWLDVSFDHARDAQFALVGAHADISCASCHVEPVATALPATVCYDCHVEDDPHALQLGRSCSTCHNETSFSERVRFDHDLTRFPLLGRHDDVTCENCHETHAFLDAPEQCLDCHRNDDVHGQRLGNDCALCHTPSDWQRWVFDHNAATDFVLDGAHDNLDCLSCHREPAVAVVELSTTCASCHRRDDVHRGEFGPDCQQCHTTLSFGALRPIQ